MIPFLRPVARLRAFAAMALSVLLLCAITAAARAQGDAIHAAVAAACANNGAGLLNVLAWVGGIVGSASVVANFRNRLPAPVAAFFDTLALNFVKTAVDSATKSAPPKP